MKLIRTFSMFVFVFCLLCSAMHAQEAVGDAWQVLNNQFMELWNKEDHQRALEVATKALEVADRLYAREHERVLVSVKNLAFTCFRLGQYAQAEPLLKRALAIEEGIHGPDDTALIPILTNLAILYNTQREFAKLEPVLKRRLAIQEKALGPDHADVAHSLNNLGLNYYAQGQYREAEPLLKRALVIHEKIHGPLHHSVAVGLENLAGLFVAQHQYAQAEPLLKRALAILEKALGPDHREVAMLLESLADVHIAQYQHEQAEELLKRALAIQMKGRDPDNVDVTHILDRLAKNYYNQDRYREAEPLIKRSLAIREKILDPGHVHIAHSLSMLAMNYLAQDRYRDAEPLLKRALAIREKAHGPDHPLVAQSLNQLGALYRTQARYQESEPLLKRSLAIREKALGPDHLEVAGNLHSLASLYRIRNELEQAIPLLKRALSIRENALGADHRLVAIILNDLGLVFYCQARYEQAEPLFRRALAISEKALGPNHPSVAATLNCLADLCDSLGQHEQAERLYKRSLAINEKALGPDHPDLAYALNNLGHLYRNLRQYAQAEPLYKRSLTIREKALGPDHPELAVSLNNLAALHVNLGEYEQAEAMFKRALAIIEKAFGSDHLDFGTTLANLARMHERQDQYAQAEPLWERSLAITEKVLGANHRDVATGLLNRVFLATRSGDWRTAVAMTDRASRIIRRHMASVLSGLSQYEQQAFLAERSFQFHSTLSLALAVPSESAVAEATAEWLLNGKALAAATLAERSRAAWHSRDPEVAETAKRLQSTRAALANLTMNAPRDGDWTAHHRQTDHLAAQEAELSKELGRRTGGGVSNDVWVGLTEARRAIPANAVYVDVARFEKYRFFGKGKESRWAAARYVAWVVPPAGVGKVLVFDLGEAEAIDAAVADFRKTMNAHLPRFGRTPAAELQAEIRSKAAAVARLVWEPLRSAVGDAPTVIISPDGALWLLPWEALPDAGGKYLIESRRVSYVVSGRDLVEGGHKIRPRGGVVFADPDYDLGVAEVAAETQRALAGQGAAPAEPPAMAGLLALRSGDLRDERWARLPGTAAEARAVVPKLRDLVGAEPSVYTGRQALEGVFRTVRSPRVLVMSTHGFFMKDQDYGEGHEAADALHRGFRLAPLPMPTAPKESVTLPPRPAMAIENPLLRCGLVLAGANTRREAQGGDDGMLTGLEIVGADLRGTDLVVLSACETGVGTIQVGEGVSGLRQAFQLAGARTVIATLWQIPDRETVALMTAFFGNLARGETKADALRKAQLSQIERLRKDTGSAHPYFWAAFTLTGSPGKAP